MMTLTELANRVGTDKGTQAGAAHGYALVYDMLLGPLRDRPGLELLEMGLAIGGPELGGPVDRRLTASPSVSMWLEHFPQARMTGFDISDFSGIRHDRFRFVRGDSGKAEDVARLCAGDARYDVILDDAAHASYHQQLGLATLIGALKPGGIYIIEDLSWQPAAIEAALPAVPLTARILGEFLATGRMPVTAAIPAQAAAALERRIQSVVLFDESQLNAMGDGYNRNRGLPAVSRGGWRGRGPAGRLVHPGFWLFSGRRFLQALTGRESANWQSVKLAVIQC